jgi:two-component system, OmpR family, alkaline phosphatase synthesis response regulator PhoP
VIFLLEDDESIRKLVTYTLEQSGYAAAGFSVPSEFWAAMQKDVPELILLDIMLPEEDGLSVLRKLRASVHWRDVPVMMMTAKNAEYDRVIGLDAGADDYISKPFGLMELLARVRAVLRRTGTAVPGDYRFGELYVCPDKHIVREAGRDVMLTNKEFSLLCLLMRSPGTAFTRDAIMDSVWGSGFDGENRTVDVHVRTLRAKLGDAGRFIETVRGVGYRFAPENTSGQGAET